jgi:hypothetical protein
MVTHGRDDSVNSRTRHVQDKIIISQFTFIKSPRSRPSSSNLTATFLSRLAQRPARVSSRRQGRIFNCFPLVRVSLVGSRGDTDGYYTSFTAGRRPSRGHTLRSPFAHQRRGRPRVPRSSCGDRHLPRSAQCRGGSERIRDPGWRAPSSRAPPPGGRPAVTSVARRVLVLHRICRGVREPPPDGVESRFLRRCSVTTARRFVFPVSVPRNRASRTRALRSRRPRGRFDCDAAFAIKNKVSVSRNVYYVNSQR